MTISSRNIRLSAAPLQLPDPVGFGASWKEAVKERRSGFRGTKRIIISRRAAAGEVRRSSGSVARAEVIGVSDTVRTG